jgi:uncharacterized membrane protein
MAAEDSSLPLGSRQDRPFSMLDTTAKVSGVIAAASALLGITYNVAFFMGDKQAWLFYLSITDNLTATLYALPFVALVVGMMAMSTLFAAILLRGPAPTRTPSRRGLAIWGIVPLAGIVVTTLLVARDQEPLRTLSFIVLGATLTLLPNFALRLIGGRIGSGMAYENRVSLALVLVSLPVVVSVCLFATSARGRISAATNQVDIELSDKQTIRGSLVRALEGGIILARNDLWIWLPRTEIKRIAEVAPTKPS